MVVVYFVAWETCHHGITLHHLYINFTLNFNLTFDYGNLLSWQAGHIQINNSDLKL